MLEILNWALGGIEELREFIAREEFNARVAGMILRARKAAGLTQRELGKLVGTTRSAIARLEDAEYEGHSLSILQRIAAALDLRLDVRLVGGRGRKVGGAR